MGAAAPYVVPALIGGGASIYGANKAEGAAQAAGDASVQGALISADAQKDALRQMRIATEPFRFGAQQSINPLLQLLGITPIALPQAPQFNIISGEPQANLTQRIEELRQRREQLRAEAGR
jgi:hypothetical protein